MFLTKDWVENIVCNQEVESMAAAFFRCEHRVVLVLISPSCVETDPECVNGHPMLKYTQFLAKFYKIRRI